MSFYSNNTHLYGTKSITLAKCLFELVEFFRDYLDMDSEQELHIHLTHLGDDCSGDCLGSRIRLDKQYFTQEHYQRYSFILLHEMVHSKQYFELDLFDDNYGNVYWKDKLINFDDYEYEYDLPYEKEAYTIEQQFVHKFLKSYFPDGKVVDLT